MKRLIWSSVGVMGLAMVSLMTGCESVGSQEIQSRGVSQDPQPPRSASAGQPAAQVPTFPQKFNVQGPETQSFGLAVTQPGPVVVDIQGQGAPVIVTLQSPGGQPITQQATGNLRMNYNVTRQDVQKNVFWLVQIRLAQPMPPEQGGRASGSVNVQYPPVNQTAVQQAVQDAASQRRQPTDQERAQAAAQVSAQMDAAFQAHKAQFEQQRQQRHAALMAVVQPIVAQMQVQAGGGVRPRGVEDASVAETSASETAATPGEEVTSRALRTLTPTTANPAITSVNVSQGQPGDPVMINGTGFGSSGGEVHFVVGPNGQELVDKSGVSSGVYWLNTQVVVTVPEASGFMGYNGFVYVVRYPDKVKSALVPFRFNPTLELREIRATTDRVLAEPIWYNNTTAGQIERFNTNPFAGFYGNDQLLVNARLNQGSGWTEESVVVAPLPLVGSSGGVYVSDSRIGTNWPYLNVRWWINPCSPYCYLGYSFQVRIIGPKGVPDGVVCTQMPCSSS